MRTNKGLYAIMITAICLLLAGCGSAPSADSAAKDGAAAAPTTPSASQDVVKQVKDSMGMKEIKGTPQRIVALEWTYTEDLLALGVQPVGVADIEGYKKWLNIKPQLAASVVDVGTRQQPNLEAIAALKPDLIIGPDFRIKDTYDKLKNIAPTLVFSPYPPEGSGDQYSEMVQTFQTIATTVNKSTEAQSVLDGLQKAYDQAQKKLKSANKDGQPFVLAQAFTNQNAAALRLFTNNSMAAQILQKIGLKNAFSSSKFEVYGYNQTTVEALTAVSKANFLYVVQNDDNVFTNQLKDNAVWKSLDFVKQNHTYALGGDTWLFGGPLSAEVFVAKVTDIFTK